MRGKSNPGIVERHSRSCASKSGGACNCEPSYMAWTWDRRTSKKVYKTFSGRGAKSEAKGWRADAVGQVRRERFALRQGRPCEMRGPTS